MEGLLNSLRFGGYLISRSKNSVVGILCLCSLLFAVSCSSASTASAPNISTHNLTIDLPGKNIVALVDDQGELTQGVQITSADRKIGLAIDQGTSLLDKDGKILEFIKVTVDSNNVTLPENTDLAGLVVDIQPQQATAMPSIKLTLDYDPSALGKGSVEIYNHTGDIWQMMRYKQVNSETNSITTTVSQFGKYGVLASTVPVETQASTTQPGLTMTLQEALSNGKPTLAEFGSVTCIPCKEMKPILEKLSVDYQDKLNVVFIEIYEQKALASHFKIMAMPTQIVFDSSGNEVTRHMGLWPRNQIDNQLNKIGIK
jgi:thioredoxin 1